MKRPPEIDSLVHEDILMLMKSTRPMKPPRPAPPSVIERILSRAAEAVLIYFFLGGLISIGVVSVLAGHFPPTKVDFKEQFEKVKGMMEKSEQVLTDLQKTNQTLASLGPQLQLIDKSLSEIQQKVLSLEAEVEKLKTEQKR